MNEEVPEKKETPNKDKKPKSSVDPKKSQSQKKPTKKITRDPKTAALTEKSDKFDEKLNVLEQRLLSKMTPNTKYVHLLIQIEQSFQHMAKIRNLHKKRTMMDSFQAIRKYPFLWEMRRGSLQKILLKKMYHSTKRLLKGVIRWKKFVIWQAMAELHLQRTLILLQNKVMLQIQYSLDMMRPKEEAEEEEKKQIEIEQEALEEMDEELKNKKDQEKNERRQRAMLNGMYHLHAILDLKLKRIMTSAWIDIKMSEINRKMATKKLERMIQITAYTAKSRFFAIFHRKLKISRGLENLNLFWNRSFEWWKRPVLNELMIVVEEKKKSNNVKKGTAKMLCFFLVRLIRRKEFDAFVQIKHIQDAKTGAKQKRQQVESALHKEGALDDVFQMIERKVSLFKLMGLSEIMLAGKRDVKNYRLMADKVGRLEQSRKDQGFQSLLIHSRKRDKTDKEKVLANLVGTCQRKLNSNNIALMAGGFLTIKQIFGHVKEKEKTKRLAAERLLSSMDRVFQNNLQVCQCEGVKELKINNIKAQHREEEERIKKFHERQTKLVGLATFLAKWLSEKSKENKHVAFAATYVHICHPEGEAPAPMLRRDPPDMSEYKKSLIAERDSDELEGFVITKTKKNFPSKVLNPYESLMRNEKKPKNIEKSVSEQKSSRLDSPSRNRHISKCQKEEYLKGKLDAAGYVDPLVFFSVSLNPKSQSVAKSKKEDISNGKKQSKTAKKTENSHLESTRMVTPDKKISKESFASSGRPPRASRSPMGLSKFEERHTILEEERKKILKLGSDVGENSNVTGS